jgi:hypothetical protein
MYTTYLLTAFLLAPSASFEVSYLIVTNIEPHTTGDTLLLPAPTKMCKTVVKLLKQFLSLIAQ